MIPRPDIDPDEHTILRRHQTSLRNILPVADPVAVGKLGKRWDYMETIAVISRTALPQKDLTNP